MDLKRETKWGNKKLGNLKQQFIINKSICSDDQKTVVKQEDDILLNHLSIEMGLFSLLNFYVYILI